jgi:lipoprotein-anchoring transpeptidase ErfK/SrfK
MPNHLRRLLCVAPAVAAATALSGCVSSIPVVGPLLGGSSGRSARMLDRPDYRLVYGSWPGEPHPVDGIDVTRIDPAFLRQEVAYRGAEPPGTIVVDPRAHHLYFVEAPGRATRYGVGVGRDGFVWSGRATVAMRRAWPDWVPPAEMVARDPHIRSQLVMTSRGLGVPGGPRSPLGARAMYLAASGRDTGYRIHGTLEPETIGTNVSSGCIRMINQDVIHLYGRASEGTPVVVLA